MSDDSIDIDDTQGDVSGVIKDSIGSIGAKIVYVGGNLVINNSTTKERATLKKIQDLSTDPNAIEKGIITREEFDALQRAIIEIKNLLERNQAYSIKAGNVQVSRTELSLKEITLKGNEYLDSRHLSVALDYYDQAIKIDPNYAYAWNNKGIALRNIGKYDEAIECYDTAIKIDPNYADAWNNKGVRQSSLILVDSWQNPMVTHLVRRTVEDKFKKKDQVKVISILLRPAGMTVVFAAVHIEVDGNKSLADVELLTREVEMVIRSKIPYIKKISVIPHSLT